MADEVRPLHWSQNWSKGEKLEGWFLSVMMDDQLDPAQVKVAWCLTFLFNSSSGAAWVGNDAIGDAINAKPETVRKALRRLVQRGHLLKSREMMKGSLCRVLRPALAFRPRVMQVGKRVPAVRHQATPDGTPSPESTGQGIPSEMGQGIPHILRGYPESDPDRVQDGSWGLVTRPNEEPPRGGKGLPESDEVERRYREIRKRIDREGSDLEANSGSPTCSMCHLPATTLDATGTPFCDEHEIHGDLPFEDL